MVEKECQIDWKLLFFQRTRILSCGGPFTTLELESVPDDVRRMTILQDTIFARTETELVCYDVDSLKLKYRLPQFGDCYHVLDAGEDRVLLVMAERLVLCRTSDMVELQSHTCSSNPYERWSQIIVVGPFVAEVRRYETHLLDLNNLSENTPLVVFPSGQFAYSHTGDLIACSFFQASSGVAPEEDCVIIVNIYSVCGIRRDGMKTVPERTIKLPHVTSAAETVRFCGEFLVLHTWQRITVLDLSVDNGTGISVKSVLDTSELGSTLVNSISLPHEAPRLYFLLSPSTSLIMVDGLTGRIVTMSNAQVEKLALHTCSAVLIVSDIIFRTQWTHATMTIQIDDYYHPSESTLRRTQVFPRSVVDDRFSGGSRLAYHEGTRRLFILSAPEISVPYELFESRIIVAEQRA